MNKYVYLLYGEAYEKYIINAVRNKRGVYFFRPFRNDFVKKLHMIHNARPLNEKMELPFKTFWFKRAIKGMDIDKDDKIFFLLYESFHLAYSRNFLQFLRAKYPQCKLVFMYLNPVTKLINDKLKNVSSCYDNVITFNEKDARSYNYLYMPYQPYGLPIIKDDKIPESDLFFIGADKGRLPKLLAIYEKMRDAGLKCDFHIIGVPKEKQRYDNDIHYNQKITYSEVLARVNATKCVLEILQNNEDYISIRTMEAYQYRKKLLTESISVKKSNYYNPEIIQVFDEIENIDTEFIRKAVDERIYDKNVPGNADDFHNWLLKHL